MGTSYAELFTLGDHLEPYSRLPRILAHHGSTREGNVFSRMRDFTGGGE